MTGGVVLLHGILRSPRCMRGLQRHLEGRGYKVLNLGYPSRRREISALAEGLHPAIEAFAAGTSGPVHFVGYSMGGLLIRAYCHRFRPARLRRVVMIGPPNQGSEVADALMKNPLYRYVYGPAGQQLGTRQEALSGCLGAVDYELGVIAGSRSLDPVSSWIIGQPSDGKVAIARTKLEGMKAHCVVKATHTFIAGKREVWELTERFLREGCFSADT